MKKEHTFSLDHLSQDEKDFLDYMYGDDLSMVLHKKPKQIHYWIRAFQCVKEKKRPPFNWPSFFLGWFWCFRKKFFKGIFYVTFVLLAAISPIIIYAQFIMKDFSFVGLSVLSSWMLCAWVIRELFLPLFGPRLIIQDYLKAVDLEKPLRRGRTPLPYFIPFILMMSLFPSLSESATWVILIETLSIILYILWLQMYWLPGKKAVCIKSTR